MISIRLAVANLVPGRCSQVQSLLRPLRPRRNPVPCTFLISGSPTVKVIAAATPNQRHVAVGDLWFPSYVRKIHFRYHEAWRPLYTKEQWELTHVHLHLAYQEVGADLFVPILGLHCHPKSQEREPLNSYRVGPHLHIEKAEQPLPNCHFPLNLGHLGQVLESVDSLTDALKTAIGVICEEVVRRYA